MSGPRAKVELGATAATISLPRASGLGPSELEVHAHGDEGVVLLAERPEAQGYLAGSLSTLSLAEVVGQIVSGVRSGLLVVSYPGGRRQLRFRDGQLVFASSSEPYERLGAVVVGLELTSPEQVLEALAEVGPGRKLGQVLVEQGALTAAQLYSAMTFLTREIAVDVFEVERGDFLFVEGPALAGRDDELKLPERTRDLVLLGMKRAEELGRLRARLPATLEVRASADAAGEDPLLLRAKAATTIGALRSAHEGSDYGYLSRLLDLLTSGELVEVPRHPEPAAPAAASSGGQGPLETFRVLVERISAALLAAGKELQPLRAFLEEPLAELEEAFAGVTLDADGRLDVERVVQNLSQGRPAIARARAYEALDAFVAFAVFSAKNVLSPEDAAALLAELRQVREEGHR